jgi:hypothetical protein
VGGLGGSAPQNPKDATGKKAEGLRTGGIKDVPARPGWGSRGAGTFGSPRGRGRASIE